MNKVVFCYDGRLRMDKEGNIYPQALNENVLQRYLYFGDTIDIFCRKQLIEKNINIYKLPQNIKNKINIIECPKLTTIKGFLFENKKFAKSVIKQKVLESDFCIIRMPSFVGRQALKICNKNNKRYLVEMVGDPFGSYWNYSLAGKFLAPISFLKTKLSIKKAKYVQYVSNDFLQKRYPTNGYFVGCSDVDLIENTVDILNRRIEKILNKTENEKIIFGTLAAIDVKFKGQEYVIKAIAELKALGHSNFEYQLVGAGDTKRLQNIVKKLNVQDCVKFLGSKSHNEVFAWLDNIDIYIQPSNIEGLSRAVLEAMSRACPCIVSNAGGNPELINLEYVFKKKNIEDLIKKINKIIYSNDIMIKESKSNFYNSKKFQKNELNKKRQDFYKIVYESEI